jgi:transposase-like protein
MSNQQKAGRAGGDDGRDPYEGLRTRARWKAAEAARVLSDLAESGKPMAAFAREHGLSVQRMFWWRGRLGEATSGAKKAKTQLVPATPRKAALLSLVPSSGAAVVVSTAGVRVEVVEPSATDPRWVAALMRAMQEQKP